MPCRTSRFVVGLVSLWAVTVVAAPPAPPPPETYDVQIRYSILAFRNERRKQFGEMMAYLKDIGFQRVANEEAPEDEAENPTATRLRGTIPAAKARLLLGERHIKSVLLTPAGAKLPEDKNQRVRVHLKLASGFSEDRQRQLSDQTLAVLLALQFQPAVGFDSLGHTKLVGSLPVGRLETLLEDLRKTPPGAKEPTPFQNVWPLVLTEVRPDLPLPAPRPPAPTVPKGQESLSPDLREILADEAKAAQSTHLEVLLAFAPAAGEQGWQQSLLKAAPGTVIEGRLGPLVFLVARPNQAPALAALPEIAAVRLPRIARSQVLPVATDKDAAAKALAASGVTALHQRGYRGKGTILAVVDSDFRGWQQQVEKKQLPASTRLVDLTRERNHNLEPDPFAGDPQQLGTGTRQALTALQAAPEADLVLLRVDAAAPYMVEGIARAINGELYRSLNLDHRVEEIEAERVVLQQRQEELLKERRQALQDFGLEEEAAKRRETYRQHQAEFDRNLKAHQQRVDRYLTHLQDMRDLKKVRVVTMGLVWESGYPVDGTSALSRYFDDRPFRAALWFQAAGDTRGQAWSGPFRDDNGNGVLQFAPASVELPEGAWTRDLNFLGWRPAEGAAALELPANTRLRVTLQWREAHEAEFSQPGDDAYREPLASFRLLLLQQLDPSGKTRPADDLAVVAESAGRPQRLEQTATWATYEQTLEIRVAQPGRYALRVEGRLPESTRPRGIPTLPALRRVGEVRPRLFLETLEGAGRVVFDTFPTGAGTIGMPGDARRVITIGAADARGKPRDYSAMGPAHNLQLLVKPELLAADEAGGSGQAAAFTAGVAAAMRSRNPSLDKWLESLPVRRGGVLQLPAGWAR